MGLNAENLHLDDDRQLADDVVSNNNELQRWLIW